jgi:hypothetical protein
MKPLIIFCILICFSCKNNSDQNSEISDNESGKTAHSLEGAWQLVSYLNYNEDGTFDTINTSATNKQIKMYSKSKIMWSRTRIYDTIDWFGCGDYTLKDNVLTEVLDYGSKSMNAVLKEKRAFVFDIILEDNKFTQIEKDSLGVPLLAENYIRLE